MLHHIKHLSMTNNYTNLYINNPYDIYHCIPTINFEIIYTDFAIK